MKKKLLSAFGLKFYPFGRDLPVEALFRSPAIDAFCRKVEFTVPDGGFALVAGDPGTGKSVTLRLLAAHLAELRDVSVAYLEHPQSSVGDFYRELGDLFNVALKASNRWGGFKSLRARWTEHIASTITRPVLIIDEAQEMDPRVLSELRILSSKEFDARALLCVVFAGDRRLLDRLGHRDLQPIESRIRRRLLLEEAPRDEMLACLDHLLDAAGNPDLVATDAKVAIAEHSAGNYRSMITHCDELFATMLDRDATVIDGNLFFDHYKPKRTTRRKT